LTCPADVSISLDATCMMDTTTANTGLPVAMDGCGSVTITYTDDVSNLNLCSGTGFITRTFTAVDDCAATVTCMQTITIVDDTPDNLSSYSKCSSDCNMYSRYNISRYGISNAIR